MIADAGRAPATSVVMAVYEPHPDYFRQAVRSILGQSWRDLELIIVEDPSPQCGEAMLDIVTDPRLRYIANVERLRWWPKKPRVANRFGTFYRHYGCR